MSETTTKNGRVYDTRFFPAPRVQYEPMPYDENDFRENVLDTLVGQGRGDRYDAFLIDSESADAGSAGTFESLSEMFARRVCSTKKKSVIFLIFGEMGSGKSFACLQLALYTALWIQKFKGGKVSDYFDMSHVAVITDDVMENQILSLRSHGVYVFDDSGAAGFSSRNAMTTGNKTISSVLQVVRPLSNVLIFSCPHSGLLDINAKRLSTYYSEVSESRHEEGVSFLKVFRLSQNMRDAKTYHSYLQHRNMTATRHWVGLPDPGLAKVYDNVRDIQMKSLIEKGMTKIEKKREKSEPKEPGRGGSPAPRVVDQNEFTTLASAYLNKPMTLGEMCEGMQMNPTTLKKYLKKNGFSWHQIPNSKKTRLVRA